MLEFWGMWSTPVLPLVTGSLCLEVEAPDMVISLGQRELFDISSV